MDFVKIVVDLILHLDVHLKAIILQYGAWTYALLFFVIFMETGFVVTPVLPGDSLIFAAGTFAALGSLNLWLLLAFLATAAVVGDSVNYWIGYFVSERAYHTRWIKKEYLDRTHAFFQKHGGKTVFLARFVPIIRTFAPFVAGIGKMPYSYFFSYNVLGGIVWVAVFTCAGYFFGNIPVIRDHFSLVIIVIILISLVPMVIEALKLRRESAPTNP